MVAVLCAVAIAGASGVVTTASADNLHDKKNKVERNIKSAQGDVEDSSKALAAANSRLESARASLAAAEAKLAETRGQLTAAEVLDRQMQAKLEAAVARLGRARHALRRGTAQVTAQRAEIGRMVAHNYEYGDPRLLGLSVMLNASSPDDLARQMNTVDNLMERETTMLDQLQATEAMLEVHQQEVTRAKKTVSRQRAAAAANLVRKQELERQAATARAQVLTLVASRKSAASEAARIKRSDLKKLAQLKKEEARIKKMILARARARARYSGATNGFLYRPVPGYITSPYGYRYHPIYGYWGLHDGIDFHAPCGTPERAGAGGTVISEYYSSVWGNRLFLDVGMVNGKRMTLIYNHISSYAVGTGANVSRGQTLAYAGTTGWSTGCHLHFTVMLDGNPVDPAPYL